MSKSACAAGIASLLIIAFAGPASALSMKQCSEKYKAAQSSGAAGSMTWSEFRAEECGTDATMELKKAIAPKGESAGAGPSMQECSSRYQAAKTANTLGGMSWNEFRKAGCPATIARRSGSVLPTSGSIYPAAISRKYSSLPEGRARELTCRDQYEANKAAGVSEMKWTEQGGGYYSECNKRLSAH